MSIPIYHQAARDGFLELLKETTKKDTNWKDEDGMTPTLWAAFEGNVEALRLLVGRGGDPDRCDNYGNTALHLASARGNMQVVTFLINFGVNIYALDIDMHTAQELAAINNADNVLRYLDAVVAKMEMEDPKKAGKLKEKANKESTKLKRNFQKIQRKADELIIKEELETVQNMKKMQIDGDNESLYSGDDQNDTLQTRKRFSEIVSTSSTKSSNISSSFGSSIFGRTISKKSAIGSVLRKINLKKENQELEKRPNFGDDDEIRNYSMSTDRNSILTNGHFKITDTEENGKMSIRKLKGLKRDSEVLFVAPPPPSSPPSSEGVESTSILNKEKHDLSRASTESQLSRESFGMFERPGFGSVAFRDSTQTASLFSYDTIHQDNINSNINISNDNTSSNGNNNALETTTTPNESSVMNESTDDSNSSNISTSNGSRSHSELESNSQQGSSIGSAGSLVMRNRISNGMKNAIMAKADDNNYAAVDIFLTTLGLHELIPIFRNERIDAHVLNYLEDNDLKDMLIPVGSRKRIIRAIKDRRSDLESDRPIEDSRL